MARKGMPHRPGGGGRLVVEGRTTGGGASRRADRLLAEARDGINTGQLQRAEQLLRNHLAAHPDDPQALHLLALVAFRAGQPTPAAQLARQAIALDDRQADFHVTLGSALLAAGRHPEGEAALRAALALKPSHGMANFNLGTFCLKANRVAEAVPYLEKAAKALRNDDDALSALGVALARSGEPARAAGVLQRVLKRTPESRQARLNLAAALAESGKTDKALTEVDRLVSASPDDPVLQFQRAMVLTKGNRAPEAIAAYEAALAARPDYADAHNNLGNLLSGRGEFEDGLGHLEEALRLSGGNPFILRNIAKSLWEKGEGTCAREAARKVLEKLPDDADAITLVVDSLRNEGRFAEAESAVREVLARRPDSPAFLALLAEQEGAKVSAGDLTAMAAATADANIGTADRIRLCFALGRYYDGLGDYPRAFDFYHRGNGLKKAMLTAKGDDDAQHEFDASPKVFDADLFRRLGDFGSGSERPIFIVGMPRSGTTLTEQILASHPDVAAGGELRDMRRIAGDLPGLLNLDLPYPECVVALDPDTVRTVTEAYLARLSDISGDARHVTDKMPGNFLLLGLIALLFPKARIIHCRRGVEATALSIYFQNFADSHPYALDLEDIGRFYRRYRDLMDHWRAVLPVEMLDVDYEALVADQEAVSREILGFCGLSWTDRVLDFHKTERPVQTASLWQVRRPMSRDAVEHWRHYEAYLDPLRNAFGA